MVYAIEPAEHRTVPRAPPRLASPTLVMAGVITAVSVLLIIQWWSRTGPAGTPSSAPQLGNALTPYLYQLPGGVTIGILLARAWGGTEELRVGTPLSTIAARWGWVWAGSSLVWTVATASSITGVPVMALATRPDLLPMIAANDHVVAHVTTVWVAMVIALFAARLTGWPTTAAMLLLVTVVTVLPATGYALGNQHEHLAVGAHRLFTVSLAARLGAAVLWLGALITLLHLRHEPGRLRRALPPFSAVTALAVLMVGLSIVGEHTSLLLGSAIAAKELPGVLLAGQALALVLLAVIGWRHRRRTAHAVVPGLTSFLILLAGELVLVLATVGVAAATAVST